jgi:hypothetical protein
MGCHGARWHICRSRRPLICDFSSHLAFVVPFHSRFVPPSWGIWLGFLGEGREGGEDRELVSRPWLVGWRWQKCGIEEGGTKGRSGEREIGFTKAATMPTKLSVTTSTAWGTRRLGLLMERVGSWTPGFVSGHACACVVVRWAMGSGLAY